MKRVVANIPDPTYDDLKAFADKEGRSVSNLAAFILEQGVNAKVRAYEKNIKGKGDPLDK